MLEISIVIPIFNEEENIAPLYRELDKALTQLGKTYEILFVNDGSKDSSWEALTAITLKDPHVKLLNLIRNMGQTAALMAGFDHAQGSIIIPLDGDGQNDPADIARLIQKLDEGFDIVSGWRKKRQDNWLRTFPSRIANRFISRITKVPLHDYGCTLKAYRREFLKGVRLYGEMHRFIPVFGALQGARVTEIPVNHHPRIAGVSKYGIERTFKVILDVLVVKFLASYAQKPIYVFGGFAFLNYLLAGIFATYSLVLKLFYDTSFIRTPLPLLAIMTVITGTLCLLLGILAELLMRTYHESQSKPIYALRETSGFETHAAGLKKAIGK
jgi:glycosyltransferase involved in cell wall biosynthesis